MADYSVKKIHHLGFVVHDLDKTLEKWEALFGVKAEICEKPELNVRYGAMEIGGVSFVINESTKPGSRWEKFLDEHGEGLEHVALEVDDIDNASEAAQERGFELRFDQQKLIHGLMTNFVEGMGVTDVEFMGPDKSSK
ncbi:MAG: VOC family protein [Spirochaetota bacterium]|nr:VOC family protein [Spirochaetota bacterium]